MTDKDIETLIEDMFPHYEDPELWKARVRILLYNFLEKVKK